MSDAHSVDPTAHLRATLTDEQRRILDVQEMLTARYMRSERDDKIAERLTELVQNACIRRDPKLPHSPENRVPGIGLALIGESGAGKSRALDYAFRKHPAFAGYGVEGSGSALISVQAPSPCTLQQLATEIVIAGGYPMTRELRENAAWRRARDRIKLDNVAFLHVGDCQRVMHQKSDRDIKKVADTFVGLMDPTGQPYYPPAQVILSGIPELKDLLDIDLQLRRRLNLIALPKVSAVDDAELLEEAIHDYAAAAHLEASFTRDDMAVGRLCHSGAYQFGWIMRMIVEAVVGCVADGHEALTIVDFANCYAKRTLEPVALNPFLVQAWDQIDCTRIATKLADSAADESVSKKRRKRRR